MKLLSTIWTLRPFWFTAIALLAPIGLVLQPNPDYEQESKCAYLIIVMAVLWITEALPVAVTALLPMVIVPLTQLDTAKSIATSYVNDTTMLFMGSLMMSVAIERCGLHYRITLSVLVLVGAQPIMLMLGLMVVTWFLSMWIINTAATAMMIPIVLALVHTVSEVRKEVDADGIENQAYVSSQDDSTKISDSELEKRIISAKLEDICAIQVTVNGNTRSEKQCEAEAAQTKDETEQQNDRKNERSMDSEDFEKMSASNKRMAKALALCVSYAATSGGMATLTGTSPNLIMKSETDVLFGNDNPVSFASWMQFAFPMAFMALIASWVTLSLFFFRCSCFKTVPEDKKKALKRAIRQRYSGLGRMKFEEVEVLLAFIALVACWLFRKPPNQNGWGSSFINDKGVMTVSDSVPGLLLTILLFILPNSKPSLEFLSNGTGRPDYQPILTWKSVSQRLPWGVIVLLGGGFAIAKSSRDSGLSALVVDQLKQYANLEPAQMNFIVCLIVSGLTEIISNPAAAQLIVPLLGQLALVVKINPLYFMMSAALSCSFAYTLPVSSPPNVIVYSTGFLKIWEMVVVGIPMNIFGILILTLAINTWGHSMFDLGTFPAIFDNISTSV